ncbi:SDR family oxidoreductase [Pleomorphomonas diazotrophica]|uniref:SDR family oxidoreductase n=1 Tax=Pleomorphomonas diazotrophica TaxID=1166257 RepID=UPI001FCEE580|nr:SDR family oxidoreductase [Pleomorphomonas diazotrophica]
MRLLAGQLRGNCRSQGGKVWLGARNADRGKVSAETLAAEGLDVRWLELDVTSDESVAAAAKIVEAAGSGLDVLLSNTGIAIRSDLPPSQQQLADIQATYDVNVFGPSGSLRHSVVASGFTSRSHCDGEELLRIFRAWTRSHQCQLSRQHDEPWKRKKCFERDNRGVCQGACPSGHLG